MVFGRPRVDGRRQGLVWGRGRSVERRDHPPPRGAEIALNDEMRLRVGAPKVTGTMTMEPLDQRGAIVLACNRALTGVGECCQEGEVSERKGSA